MKPQPQLLIFISLSVLISCVVGQTPASISFYNSDGCNTTATLVAEYQIGIVADGCSDNPCYQGTDNWYSQICSQPLQITPGLSYISSYRNSDCSNETNLDERILFNASITTFCLNTDAGYSFFIDNTCTTNGQITLSRFLNTNCSGDPDTVLTGMDGTCNTNGTMVYCAIGMPPQTAPSAPEPMAVPESTQSPTSPPQSSVTPKAPTSTPKASTAARFISAASLVLVAIFLM